MNPQPEQDLELRLQQLETELNGEPTTISQSQTPQPIQTNNSPTEQSQLGQLFNWFNNLSDLGKLIVVGVAAIVGIAILQAVLKLVAAVISLAILAVLLYLVYQFFLSRSAETKD